MRRRRNGNAGVNYFATNGTLNFAPGVTSMIFGVNIINDHVITANHTVLLSLSNPQGGAVLGSPSTAAWIFWRPMELTSSGGLPALSGGSTG